MLILKEEIYAPFFSFNLLALFFFFKTTLHSYSSSQHEYILRYSWDHVLEAKERQARRFCITSFRLGGGGSNHVWRKAKGILISQDTAR